MTTLIECVPNFSFAEDADLLERFRETVRSRGGILLDASSDVDHRRSVVSFCVTPAQLVDLGLALIRLARDRIDLTQHVGVHPRIGACDVFPLIALDGSSSKECVELARALGARVGEELAVPVYFYGAAALRPSRMRLPDVRRGGFEGLVRELGSTSPPVARIPDVGPPRPHPTAGATAIGVRPFLIAFNIVLATRELGLARAIAREIRESSGGLAGIRALGLPLESKGLTQVSVNVCDHGKTGLVALFERVEAEARARGIDIVESELIGLAPRAALDAQIAKRVRLPGFDPLQHVLEDNLAHRRRS